MRSSPPPTEPEVRGSPHWTCEARGCAADLTDAAALGEALRAAADRARATVVGEASHAYHGGGLTLVLLCAESHLLVSTWPEAGYALVEVFLCGDRSDPAVAAEVLRGALGPEEWLVHRLAVDPPPIG